MYRIETHLHTAYISKCGWLGAAAIIDAYVKAGYSAICVTDHYNRAAFDYADIDLTNANSKTEEFLLGYRRLKREAKKHGIRVYEGAELRFDGSDNDYLLYGFHHELLANPEQVMSQGLAAFYPQCCADGALLVQAHPFRNKCTPAPVQYLDGVEVLNCNPRHDNHDDLAYTYAKEHDLLMTAGSDCHRPEDVGTSGILSKTLPADGFEFAELLRSGNYKLITSEQGR
ncbi:MAG: PHP domain-containing protein [Lachnospiraceae bacterium]